MEPNRNTYLARNCLCKIFRSWADREADQQGLSSMLIFTVFRLP